MGSLEDRVFDSVCRGRCLMFMPVASDTSCVVFSLVSPGCCITGLGMSGLMVW